MSQNDFPAWRYGPDGKAAIFECEENVPKGWVSHPRELLAVSAPEPDSTTTREAVIAEFEKLGASYKKNAPTAALQKQLAVLKAADANKDSKLSRAEVVAALTEKQIAFDVAASDEALYALLVSFGYSSDASK